MRWIIIMLLISNQAKADAMHDFEITATTYACSDVGYRLIQGNAQPIVPIIGVLGCGIYRLHELNGKNNPLIAKEFGLDCLGMLIRTLVEVRW